MGWLDGSGRSGWGRFRSPPQEATAQAVRLLTRAAPVLRLPTSPHDVPEILPDGSGLRCGRTGRVYPYHNGVLDVLAEELILTETQHLLNTSLTSWIYDRGRDVIMRSAGLPPFTEEVTTIDAQLQVQSDYTVLDLACGHGNFTIAWAQRVGPDGLVVGLDISPAMLHRAAMHVERAGLGNVLLIRGDAHHLPFADSTFSKVNCSGGFHQLPDLPQALREIARVSGPSAVLTASTFAEGVDDSRAALKHWFKRRFALHFVPLPWLGEQVRAVGYTGYDWSLPGGWFGYMSARKDVWTEDVCATHS